MELIGAVQNYSWGMVGMKSIVAQLAKVSFPNLVIKDDQPFAELWIGTHSNGPAVLKGTGESLSAYIEKNQQCLGSRMRESFGDQLPFLFKVLSVGQALSIQAHPNKSHAEELHKINPSEYKDANHKPEMAIALTPFQALCGFRPHADIVRSLKEFPELSIVVGTKNADNFMKQSDETNLKTCFATMMSASDETVAVALNGLKQRMTIADENEDTDVLRELFLRLYEIYPGDIGCCSIFLLNYFTLKPGEALFLGPNVIHAYLFGDCMECMACSDNVVRAGLTPKLKDIPTLVSMLEYSMLPAKEMIFPGIKVNDVTTLFNPPVPDFAVEKIEIPSGFSNVDLQSVDSASVFIVIEAEMTHVSFYPENKLAFVETIQRGTVLFLEAGQGMTIGKRSSAILAFRAFCSL